MQWLRSGCQRWALLFAGLLLMPCLPAVASYHQRPEVRAYMAEVASEHGFELAQLQQLFADAQRNEQILEAIARPAERVRPWHEYRCIFLTQARIDQGVAFWEENQAALARAEMTYGVPASVVVAIIGVETFYGRHKGRYRVLDALSTLAFDYPPRSSFFRRELTEFLLLTREEAKDPRELYGSYAGAMGYGQFISSSYRAYAVDFDGSGVRDIWDNRTDAIGSVANYFRVHGWRQDAPVTRLLAAQQAPANLLSDGLAVRHQVADLRRAGVQVPELADDTRVALVRMEGAAGDEYWLALHNFYVITRYNRSAMYALAVYQLSAAIAAAKAETTSSYEVCQ